MSDENDELPKRACGNCRYWAFEFESEGDRVGPCRRFPPHVLCGDDGDTFTASPYVEDKEWCGEFAVTVH